MGSFRSACALGAAILLVSLAGLESPSGAQETAGPAKPQKSVYGALQSVDTRLNAVVMKSKSGERLAWRFDAGVVAELALFKPGDPMIVIYRPITSSDKRVTAVAFPGSAASALYVNRTGSRVILRSAPDSGGVCGGADAASITDSVIAEGGTGEAAGACWCCALPDKSCRPMNKTGNGKAVLVGCFE
jgi:hypothetical protein